MLSIDSLNNMHIIRYKSLDYVHPVFELELAPAFDTEVSGDTYVMNMSQFTAGMYMVRVYTESGVTVKRVTVMQ